MCQAYHKQHLSDSPMGKATVDNSPGIFYDRALSAWKVPIANRDQGREMLKVLKAGDHVVFYSIDRGFRNMGDWHTTMARWREQGIFAHFVTDNINMSTAYGRAHAAYVAVAAELYADLTSERTREAALIRKIQGKTRKPREKRFVSVPSELRFDNPVQDIPAQYSGRVFMYERCSSNAQYISGLGMAVQSEANLRYAKSLVEAKPGLVLIEQAFKDEAISSFSIDFKDRPAGGALLKQLKSGDHLIVYRLDRAWRSTKDAILMVEDFLKRGITVHFVKEAVEVTGPQGEQWVAMMSSFAKLESSIKSRRKIEMNAQCRATGRPWNRAPSGCKIVYDKKQRTKRMAYDREDIAMNCMPYVLCKERGYTPKQAIEICQAIEFARANKSPVCKAPRLWLHKSEKRIETWRQQLPQRALESCFARAREIIDTQIDDQFKTRCSVPQPWQGSCETYQLPQVNF